jgi:hypothetical protein
MVSGVDAAVCSLLKWWQIEGGWSIGISVGLMSAMKKASSRNSEDMVLFWHGLHQ